jgi:hypothetical protein
MLQGVVVSDDGEVLAIEIVPPFFESDNNCQQFLFMSRIASLCFQQFLGEIGDRL